MLLSKFARDERRRIIEAFQRLGESPEAWSRLVGPEPTVSDGGQMPGDPFWPPAFNPYEQTSEEWKALALAALQNYLDEFLKSYQACVNIGLDEPMEVPKQRRVRNASINERYEWAALRLIGDSWKEIAVRYGHCATQEDLDRVEDAVRKTATNILRRARLGQSGNKKAPS